MRIPRIYHPELPGGEIALSDDAANHRPRAAHGCRRAIQLFDGSNQVFDAEITRADKKRAREGAAWRRGRPGIPAAHSPGGDVAWGKMEFTIQKSIELGVSLITPLFLSAAALNWMRNV